jgi:hypothetical protein
LWAAPCGGGAKISAAASAMIKRRMMIMQSLPDTTLFSQTRGVWLSLQHDSHLD